MLGNQYLGTGTKWCCVHTLRTQFVTVYIVTPFRPVRRHFENELLVVRTKQRTARNLQKLCAHRNLVPTFVPDYKVETLWSSTGTVPEFWRGHLKKGGVHISVH